MLKLHKHPYYIIPLIIVVLSFATYTIWEEYTETPIGVIDFLMWILYLLWSSLFFHWYVPVYRKACLLTGLATASVLTILGIVNSIVSSIYPRSFVLSFMCTFFMGLLMSSLVGFLPFVKRRSLNKKIKRVLIVMAVVSLLVFAIPFILLAIMMMPSVYYAEFDAIQKQFVTIPEVTIVNTWKHEDLSLEDCGFTLKVRDCPLIRIDFYENQEWKELFKHIDGIRARIGADNEYSVIYMSVDDFRKAGIHITNLIDVITHLEHVLEVLSHADMSSRHETPDLKYWVNFHYPIQEGTI